MGKLVEMKRIGAFGDMEVVQDLTAQLKKIVSSSRETEEDKVFIMHSLCPRSWFEKMIARELLHRKMIASDLFLCGAYVAKVLGEIASGMPENSHAFDFLKCWEDSKDPKCLQGGGDFCLALCGVFPARATRRLMKIEYYRQMGTNFYYRYYGVTGKDIGFHMANNFNAMEDIVRSVIGNYR